MDANENGIGFTRKELAALLSAASNDETDRNRYGVLFAVRWDRVFARASNGREAVEADGIADGHQSGEWLVERDFLRKVSKNASGGDVIRLPFSGASLHRALVEGFEIVSDEDAAIAQHSFPNLDDALKTPSGRKQAAHVAVGDKTTCVLMSLVACAADRVLTLRVPATPDHPAIYEAENESTETKWTLSVAPVRVEKPKGKGRPKGNDRQGDLLGSEAAE